MSSLPYAQLQDGKSTRLLRLLPGSEDTDQIQCELFNCCLDVKEAHIFEALSYCWGNASITEIIIVNGHTFHATVNLAQALRSLRHHDAPRVLWVDAVCINQEDIKEQGAQVAMMWEIYASASSVIVWLGQLDRDCAVAMENIGKGAAQAKLEARKKWDRSGQQCSCHAGDGLTQPDRTGVLKLIGREWFTRVWVLQEVGAAKRVVVACGKMTVDGGQFYDGITSAAFWYTSMAKILRKVRPALELMNRSELSSIANKKLCMIELIESFRTWKATKPIDKVYALLNMSSDASTAQELVPDYTISLEQLAQKLIKFAFPSASIKHDHKSTTPGEVTFEVDGLLLGQLGMMTDHSSARTWSIDGHESDLPGAVYNRQVLEEFNSDHTWVIQITNERKLRRGVVVLLRGAVRPSVLRFEDTSYRVDMLATPEPIRNSPCDKLGEERKDWSFMLKRLSAETSDMTRFQLSWDPFRAPYPEEISRFTPSPTDHRVQWEAAMETIRDAAEMGEAQESHDCRTLAELWLVYRKEKEQLRNGTSQYSITIHDAAWSGYVGTLKLLLDTGADVNAIHPTLGVTALHIAVHQGHVKIVDELLYAGADADMLNPDGVPALDEAINKRQTEAIKLLLSYGASPNPVDPGTRTYLIHPCITGHIEIVKALLDAGADPNASDNLGSMYGLTALLMAAELGHFDVIKALLEKGANVNARTSDGTTPLYQAAMNGHVAVAKLLLERGADVNAQHSGGATPWDVAVYRGQDGVATVLHSAGGIRNMFF